jgi:transcriptional regulator with XRE-family HTH domain
VPGNKSYSDPPPLSEQLRDAIKRCHYSRYEISRRTGVSQSSLSKFVLGQRPGLSFDAMDKIGKLLRLSIYFRFRSPNRGKSRQ